MRGKVEANIDPAQLDPSSARTIRHFGSADQRLLQTILQTITAAVIRILPIHCSIPHISTVRTSNAQRTLNHALPIPSICNARRVPLRPVFNLVRPRGRQDPLTRYGHAGEEARLQVQLQLQAGRFQARRTGAGGQNERCRVEAAGGEGGVG